MGGAFTLLNNALWQMIRSFWPLWLILAVLFVVYSAVLVYQQRRLARSGIYDVDGMTGTMFEHYLTTLFRHLGYKVEHTGKRGDFGADLVVSKDGVRTIVQAKRYTKNVGIKAVQEAVAAKGMYRCTAAMVVTNRGYTKPAQTLAQANDVTLWDREHLIAKMLVVRDKTGIAVGSAPPRG